jgi:hypothetical protein
MALRCCERYGIFPFGTGPNSWGSLARDQQRLLLDQESIRQIEEARAAALSSGAGAGAD